MNTDFIYEKDFTFSTFQKRESSGYMYKGVPKDEQNLPCIVTKNADPHVVNEFVASHLGGVLGVACPRTWFVKKSKVSHFSFPHAVAIEFFEELRQITDDDIISSECVRRELLEGYLLNACIGNSDICQIEILPSGHLLSIDFSDGFAISNISMGFLGGTDTKTLNYIDNIISKCTRIMNLGINFSRCGDILLKRHSSYSISEVDSIITSFVERLANLPDETIELITKPVADYYCGAVDYYYKMYLISIRDEARKFLERG